MQHLRRSCSILLALGALVGIARAADVISNGDFTANISGWTLGPAGPGTTSHDAAWGGGSLAFSSNPARNTIYTTDVTQGLGTITPGSQVWVSLDYYKRSVVVDASKHDIQVFLVHPDLSETSLWVESTVASVGVPASGSWGPVDVGASLSTAGTYQIRIEHDSKNGRDAAAQVITNIDNVVVDVQGAANAAPTLTSSTTAASPASIQRAGTATTTLSATFNDTDQPGVGAFDVTLQVREPDNSTVVALATAATNGTQGVTITDNGGGSYTASLDWDPGVSQTLGAYDLYFQVSDGTDSATDDFTANPDELTLTNAAPAVTAGNTTASPSAISPVGVNPTTLSTTFTDADQPGVGAFTVNYRVREPDNSTVVSVVTSATNGTQGLTITDNGGGSYTASVDWDPGNAQARGTYDLYFEVSDGTDNAVDDYTSNLDELTLTNLAPTLTAGVTAAAPASISPIGANATTLSATFQDDDVPAIGAFLVTFRVREPDNSTVVAIATAATTGTQGVTVTPNGGGSYTASVDWDPGDAQARGTYDLYFEVSDGTDNAVDDYTANLDELTLTNLAPTLTAGVTAAAPASISPIGANATTLSATFQDDDIPTVAAFTVTFRVREPDNSTVVAVATAATSGTQGVTITPNGGGSYTASVDWDPGDAQARGAYDLYFEVNDGTDNAVDDYTANLDELTLINIAPTISSGDTSASPVAISPVGANTTTLSTTFTDTDQPGVGAFNVTFKVREPDNATEVVVASAATNGAQGVTITDGGSGNYTASVDWDPGDAQARGTYDLYFEVNDGTDNAVDDYTANLDELTLINIAPTVSAGSTSASPAAISPVGANPTTLSTTFTDTDQPGVGAFTVSFKVREPDNATEVVVASAATNGAQGVTITDGGGGSYTASVDWDPGDAQARGTYDLYFEVSDGVDAATDDYANNLDELTLTNLAPVITAGNTSASPTSIEAVGANLTTLSGTFTDGDQPGVGAFTVTFRVREPDNSTVVAVAAAATNGTQGVTITDGGGGSYTASVSWDPGDAQTLGAYDLYFEVSDGSDAGVDDYANNLDELTLLDTIINEAPTVVAGATTATPASVFRAGTNSTTLSATFTDTDDPGIGAFNVTFQVRQPDDSTVVPVVANSAHGANGVTIVANGGGSYTASVSYDPDDALPLGLYDLYFEVSDGFDAATDGFASNLDELTLLNRAPTLVAGNSTASPASISPVGANATTLSTTFTDADQPGITGFTVTVRVREPDNATEVVVANAAAHGTQGVTITDLGGSNYSASVDWDPGDAQARGAYDLFFEITDAGTSVSDAYSSNLDELTLTNLAPSIVAGATSASPASIEAVGANPTTLSATFTDSDQPGIGAFTVTFRVREPDNSTEIVVANAATNGTQGVSIVDGGGGSYTASVAWDPGDAQALGAYDLQFEVSDGSDNSTDAYGSNPDELEILETVINQAPVVAGGATTASPATVNRAGTDATTLSATFDDADQPGVGAFTVGFSVRQPDDSTVVVVVSGSGHGANGVTITDNGGGSYTASVEYDPADALPLGAYDLYFEVSDGADSDTDPFTSNLDELTLANRAPTIASGAPWPSPTSVNRVGANTTTLAAGFTDLDEPPVGDFLVTFRVREPDNSTEVSVAEGLAHGQGGVTVAATGGGAYIAQIAWDPGASQALGLYDLYVEINDGNDSASDGYANNLDELSIIEIVDNNAPVIAAGATAVSPPSVERSGAATTEVSVVFSDADGPGVGAFTIDLVLREPYAAGYLYAASGLQNGTGGLTITDQGGNSYRASIDWDPPDNALVGYYDLEARVSDGTDQTIDAFAANPTELLITNTGENQPPVVQHDETSAAPSGIPRVGATSTTLGATFLDADAAGIGSFTVSFAVREPDDSTVIALATDAAHGTGGVTIADLGSGVYRAEIDWDPGDTQAAGFYDLYFSVSDGEYISIDTYINNEDELELFDDIPNQSPTTIAGNTSVSPVSITRFGSEYTMLRAEFTDPDHPGATTFTITFSVRDPSSSETVIVNAATDGNQGLRVRALGGDQYDASVLWDPPVGQVTGTYDLQFTVQDAGGLSTTDAYGNNADELTITATGVAGDGNLLRRSHTAEGCGGAASGCHNILDHQAQDCLVCHIPHGSSNILLIKETITTPNSGDLPVVYKTTGTGDPDNDPDPTIGDPTSGVPADDSDGVFTGVCEVCHTTTKYHRNDGTQSSFGHKNAQRCAGCHSHADGFPNSGGESEGGSGCSCHSGIGDAMTVSDSAYHHLLSSIDPDYTISAKTCLMCHVDHDVFRPDTNPGIGTRAKNLRVDTTTPVTTGNAAVLSDSDYIPTGTGGICLSCHTSAQTKGYTQPDGTTETIVIDKADFDAATSSHNYDAGTVFSSDASTFRANCVKCHDDETATEYQQAGQSFATHTQPYRRMLNSFGTVSPTDPLEENHCFGCHSTSSNPNAGSNQDYFAAKAMSNAALALETVMGYTYAHPTTSFSGRHKPVENGADLADGATRHAECADCHNVHAARAGNHDSSSNLVSNPLKGAWGVEPTFGALPVPTDNGNVFSSVTGYTKVDPAVSEYQICLKCHSDYTTLPAGSPNIAEEIDPRYPSTHGIMSPGTNSFCNSTTMFEPWGTSKTAWCSDCHRSDVSTDPGGPHGSNVEHLLVATITSDDVNGTPLCMVCHRPTVYWDGSAASSRFSQHPATKGAHQLPKGCFECHMWDYASTAGLGVNNVEDLAAGRIFVHGMNKRHIYNERTGGAGFDPSQGQDAFVGGYIADMDYAARECWAEVCKTHSGQGY